MKIATLIKPIGDPPFRQYLWRCCPPIEGHEFVLTSYPTQEAANLVGFEIYAFPANSDGRITDYGELGISQKGWANTPGNHAALFRDAGWVAE